MPCNLSYLNRMSGGNKDFVREMIRLFLKQAPQELEKLQHALSGKELPKAKEVVHKMKSSAAMVGAEDMVAELKDMETLVVAGAANIALSEAFSRLEQHFSEVRQELEPMVL